MITCTDCAFRPRETLFELRDGPETVIEMARASYRGREWQVKGVPPFPCLCAAFERGFGDL